MKNNIARSFSHSSGRLSKGHIDMLGVVTVIVALFVASFVIYPAAQKKKIEQSAQENRSHQWDQQMANLDPASSKKASLARELVAFKVCDDTLKNPAVISRWDFSAEVPSITVQEDWLIAQERACAQKWGAVLQDEFGVSDADLAAFIPGRMDGGER